MVAVFLQNGVSPTVAQSAASALADDRETAITLCRSYYPALSEENRLDIMKLLNRRGYSADVSREAARQLLSETED